MKFSRELGHEIPKEWKVVKLGEIADIKRGASPRPKGDPRYFGGRIPWIKISDLARYKKGMYLVATEDSVTEDGRVKSVYLEDGSLIISNSGTIGEPVIISTGRGGCIHDGFISVNPQHVDKYFLYYFFDFKKTEFQLKAQRGTQGNMNTILWKSIKIPLPPLPEQRRIAEILSTVDEAIQRVDEAIRRTERLKRGLMQRLLTRGLEHREFKFSRELGCEIPKEWKVVRLEEVCVEITDGSHWSPKSVERGDYRIATVANLKETQIDIESCKFISREDYLRLLKEGDVPRRGDILFSKDGTVGIAFAFKQDAYKIGLLSSIAIIRPDSRFLHSEFGAYVLKFPTVFRQIAGRKTGTALRRIVLSHLRTVKIPLPPLEEQRRIAAILSTVDEKLELERKRKEKLNRIKRGLMNDLLTGKRRVKG